MNQPSDNKKKNNNNRKRRRPNNKNKGKAPSGSGPDRDNSAQAQGGPSNKNRNRNRRRRNYNSKNRNNSKKPKYNFGPEGKVINTYYTLLEEYITARLKFFTKIHSDKEAERIKNRRSYYRALEKWRFWQEGLGDDEKKYLDDRSYAHKPDRIYTTENEITFDSSKIDWEGPFKDQHYLPTQKDSDFSNDQEESSGTIEDYTRLKEGYVVPKFKES